MEVRFTPAAESKCFRYISKKRLKNLVKDKGRWNKKEKDNLYRFRAKNKKGKQVIVLVNYKKKDDTALVVTQKCASHELN